MLATFKQMVYFDAMLFMSRDFCKKRLKSAEKWRVAARWDDDLVCAEGIGFANEVLFAWTAASYHRTVPWFSPGLIQLKKPTQPFDGFESIKKQCFLRPIHH